MLARLKGFRTLLIFSPVALLGLLQMLDGIDMTPLLVWLGIPEPSRAALATVLAILAVVLRWYTTTPLLQAAPTASPGEPR